MVTITNKIVNAWIKHFVKKINQKYTPELILLFGSRARKDHLLESDVDMIIVSKKFKNIKWPVRLGDVAVEWEGFVDIEPLCYTPEEFAVKKKQIGIVQQAVKEGVVL